MNTKKIHTLFPYFSLARTIKPSLLIIGSALVMYFLDFKSETDPDLEKITYLVPGIIMLFIVYRYLFYCIWYITKIRNTGKVFKYGSYHFIGKRVSLDLTAPYDSELKEYDISYEPATPRHNSYRFILLLAQVIGFVIFTMIVSAIGTALFE